MAKVRKEGEEGRKRKGKISFKKVTQGNNISQLPHIQVTHGEFQK